MNAARAQQNRMHAQNALTRTEKSEEASRQTSSSEQGSRPRASVEPFQITRPTVLTTTDAKTPTDSSVNSQKPAPVPSQNPRSILSPPKDLTDRVVYRKPLLGEEEVIRQQDSPSPPRDPYPSLMAAQDRPTLLIDRPDAILSSAVPVAIVNNVITANAARRLTPPTVVQQYSSMGPATICAQGGNLNDDQMRGVLSSVCSGMKALNVNGGLEGAREDTGKVPMADQVSVRPDTPRAAKRRSWVQQESVLDEAEYIRKILCEQQKKGRTHLNLDHHLETFLNLSQPQHIPVERTDLKEQSTAALTEMPSTSEEHNWEGVNETEGSESLDVTQNDDDPTAEKEHSLDVSQSESSDSDMTPERAEDTAKLIKPPPEKGILRPSGVKSSRGNIVFDPLALLLDAALEGEIGLVKSSAAKMSNLSTSNDEGITALHNGICAGHFEIVRFLVENNADVNAQDSDGWTPLHCAASCNNLPMVRLLVESGACPFAQTLSDLETPAEKCEEDEDGYDGCQLYLQAVHANSGSVNDHKMYTAYAYDAVRDDELSFEKGECLRVIDRERGERAWWLCDRVTPTHPPGKDLPSRGLVPRNYLCLYPCLEDRPEGFVPFDLPGSRQMDGSTVMMGELDSNIDDDDQTENNNSKIDIAPFDEQPALSVN